ncbi:hypothetical protein ENBRE01_3424 [Enteropsectra breve]|nr:hypothetical protein ENBRE01_3424 [Enteropsectra breve]
MLYIGKIDPNNETLVQGLFLKEFWSCYDSVINGQVRTINGVEGWHRHLYSSCRIAHPNLAKFISNLQKGEARIRFKVTWLEQGNFDIADKDYKHEEKLKIACGSVGYVSSESYLKMLDTLAR